MWVANLHKPKELQQLIIALIAIRNVNLLALLDRVQLVKR